MTKKELDIIDMHYRLVDIEEGIIIYYCEDDIYKYDDVFKYVTSPFSAIGIAAVAQDLTLVYICFEKGLTPQDRIVKQAYINGLIEKSQFLMCMENTLLAEKYLTEVAE